MREKLLINLRENICYFAEINKRKYNNYYEVSRGAGAQTYDCKGKRLWLRFILEEMIVFNIFFSSLWCQGKTRR